MITISPKNENYKMNFSHPGSGQRGFVVYAQSIHEIHQAIDHYYFREHDKQNCPLCRAERK